LKNSKHEKSREVIDKNRIEPAFWNFKKVEKTSKKSGIKRVKIKAKMKSATN